MDAQEPGAVRKQLDLALDDLLLGAPPRFVFGRAIRRLVFGRRDPRDPPSPCPRFVFGRREPAARRSRSVASGAASPASSSDGLVALVLVVASRGTAAPTAPASPAPRAGTLLIGVALVIGAILLGGRPALLGDDRVDQIVLAQTAIPVDRELGREGVKIGERAGFERVAIEDGHGATSLGG